MKSKHEKLSILVFLSPALILYGLFVLYPIVSALLNSAYQWRGIGAKKWTGLDNYAKIFTDENFLNALLNTGKYILFQVPIIVVLALFIALVISNAYKSKWKGYYRAVVFFPYILPLVATAMLWSTIYNPISGLLNGVLELIGFSGTTEWLGRTQTALGSILGVSVWHSVGFYIVLLVAGISNIPGEIFEAAEIDGANKLQKSIYIMIPMLKDVLQVVVVFVVINSLKIFEMPQLLTGGGPDRSTEPISLYIYEQAFKNYNFGYASAIGVVFFVLIFILTLMTLRVMRGGNK